MKNVKDVSLTRPEKAIIVTALCFTPTLTQPTMNNVDNLPIDWAVSAIMETATMLALVTNQAIVMSTLEKLETELGY